MASLTPARIAGHDREIGSIAAGKQADLLVLDPSLEVQQVYIAGEELLTLLRSVAKPEQCLHANHPFFPSPCLLVSLSPCLFSHWLFRQIRTGAGLHWPLAADNTAAREAILLAVEEANAAEDKVAGRPVAVLHPEVKDNAESAQAVAIRLITIDRVVALLAGTGPAGHRATVPHRPAG